MNEQDTRDNSPSVSEQDRDQDAAPDTSRKPTFLQIMLSVMAAAVGVQSDKNRERDFSQNSPMPYIVGGLIFTVLFVFSIIGIVMLVLPD